jgi:hypothetical protein
MPFVSVLDDCSLSEALDFVAAALLASSIELTPPPVACPSCGGPVSLVKFSEVFFPILGIRPDGSLHVDPDPSAIVPTSVDEYVCSSCGLHIPEMLDLLQKRSH